MLLSGLKQNFQH